MSASSTAKSNEPQIREHSFYWPAETPAEEQKETNNKPSDSSCSVAYKPLKSLLAFPGGAKRRARSLVLCKVGEESWGPNQEVPALSHGKHFLFFCLYWGAEGRRHLNRLIKEVQLEWHQTGQQTARGRLQNSSRQRWERSHGAVNLRLISSRQKSPRASSSSPQWKAASRLSHKHMEWNQKECAWTHIDALCHSFKLINCPHRTTHLFCSN